MKWRVLMCSLNAIARNEITIYNRIKKKKPIKLLSKCVYIVHFFFSVHCFYNILFVFNSYKKTYYNIVINCIIVYIKLRYVCYIHIYISIFFLFAIM